MNDADTPEVVGAPSDGGPVRISIVFPAYQEEGFLQEGVEDVLAGMRSRAVPFEIVIVENGSRDRTFEVATELAARHPEVTALRNPEADYGKALRRGLLAARGDAVVNFDVDLYDLGFLDTATAEVLRPGGPAVVVGSKRGVGALDQRHWTRKLVTAVFSTLLRVGFGLRVSDTHGMKAMRRAAVMPVAERCLFGVDLFDTELILRVERAGLGSGEVPITVEERRPARTPIASRIARSVAGLVRLRIALWRERMPSN
jgi:glycosyltransferase involved in cell wall biosynthesis